MKASMALFALVVFAGLTQPSKPHTPSPWEPLFDGKTTAGWRGWRQQTMPDGWKVEDGALTRGGKAGDIVSMREFGDFELEVEWKIAAKANSGLFYRVVEHPGDPDMWMVAPEYQIIDDRGYPSPLKPTQKTASNYDLQPPGVDATKPAGEWNTTRILADGRARGALAQRQADRRLRVVVRRMEPPRRREQIQGSSALRAREVGPHRRPGPRRLDRVPLDSHPRASLG